VHGVGLGLFVAEGIVRRHGGSLSAANRRDGPGAVFRIELPARPPEPGFGPGPTAEAAT
jgi:two-component system sensor histidine kinase KdpD